MLIGTRSSSSSSVTSVRYPLAHIYRVLMMAPRFIDMHRENIFVRTASASSAALNKILLNEEHWQSSDPEARIRAAIAQHNAQIPDNQLQKEQLSDVLNGMGTKTTTTAAQHVKRNIEDEINEIDALTHPIDHYEWAVVCKLVMQSGNLLPQTLEVQMALELLISQLKDIYEVQNSEKYKKINRFMRTDGVYFQEFLGQLSVLCQIETVVAIHQYLYLGHLALQQSAHNNVSEGPIAMTLAPGLFQGLGIFGQIIPRNGDIKLDTDAHRREYDFFKKRLMDIMELPMFSQPFNASLYVGFRQPDFSVPATVSAPLSSPRGERTSEEGGSRSFTSMFKRFGLSSSSSSSSSVSPEKPPSRRNSGATPPALLVPPSRVPPLTLPSTPSVRFQDPEPAENGPGYGILHDVIMHSPSIPFSPSSSSLGSSTSSEQNESAGNKEPKAGRGKGYRG